MPGLHAWYNAIQVFQYEETAIKYLNIFSQTLFSLYFFSVMEHTEVMVNADLEWDKFHLMISRSTTPDIIKMVSKVEEFLSQQLHSSKRVFISMGPLTTSKPVSLKSKSSNDDGKILKILQIACCDIPLISIDLK